MLTYPPHANGTVVICFSMELLISFTSSLCEPSDSDSCEVSDMLLLPSPTTSEVSYGFLESEHVVSFICMPLGVQS